MNMLIHAVTAVGGPLTITVNPQDQTLATADDLMLSAAASGGTDPITWKWYKDNSNTPMAGQEGTGRSASLSLPSGQFADGDEYRCIFFEGGGTNISTFNATITVSGCALPVITGGTESPTYNIDEGDNLLIEATATGAVSWTTEWYNIFAATPAWQVLTSGSGNTSYWLSNGTADDGYQDLDYKSTFTNSCGTVERVSKINVVYPATPLSVQTQPSNKIVETGGSATFNASSIGGTAPVTVQWYRNGVAIAGKTSTTLTLTQAETDAAISGNQTFYAIFTDSATPTAATAQTNTVSITRGTPPVASVCACHTPGGDNDCCDYLGWPYALDGPGNITMRNNDTKIAQPFCARVTGNITHYAMNVKYATARPGYSGGTLGTVQTCLYNADANGDPYGNPLGCFTELDPLAGGDGPSDGGNLKKRAFSSPIPVVAGQAYALVHNNTDSSPSSNFTSINLARDYPYSNVTQNGSYWDFMTADQFFQPRIQGPATSWSPNTPAPGWYHGVLGASPGLAWHRCMFSVWYDTGDRNGQDYVGGRFGDEFNMNTTSWIRTYFKATKEKIGTALHFKTLQDSGSGTITGRVKNMAGNTLATATLTANGNYWYNGNLNTSVTFTAGTRYYIDWSSSVSHQTRAIHTSFNNHTPPWAEDTVREQNHLAGHGFQRSTNSGASWSTPSGGDSSTIGGWYVETTCPATGGGTLPSGAKISYVTHSLTNSGFSTANNFSESGGGGLVPGNGFIDAMNSVGFVAQSVASDPGANVFGALAHVTGDRPNWINSDVIVLDFIINGGESATAFEAEARNVNNYIRSQSSTIKIVWMEGHSSDLGTVGAQSNVLSRWNDKNPTLQTMLGDGNIDGVVPWAAFAEANKTLFSNGGLMYSGDGVHLYSNQKPYAQQGANYLATI